MKSGRKLVSAGLHGLLIVKLLVLFCSPSELTFCKDLVQAGRSVNIKIKISQNENL